jgi:hypothetical protein
VVRGGIVAFEPVDRYDVFRYIALVVPQLVQDRRQFLCYFPGPRPATHEFPAFGRNRVIAPHQLADLELLLHGLVSALLPRHLLGEILPGPVVYVQNTPLQLGDVFHEGAALAWGWFNGPNGDVRLPPEEDLERCKARPPRGRAPEGEEYWGRH